MSCRMYRRLEHSMVQQSGKNIRECWVPWLWLFPLFCCCYHSFVFSETTSCYNSLKSCCVDQASPSFVMILLPLLPKGQGSKCEPPHLAQPATLSWPFPAWVIPHPHYGQLVTFLRYIFPSTLILVTFIPPPKILRVCSRTIKTTCQEDTGQPQKHQSDNPFTGPMEIGE